MSTTFRVLNPVDGSLLVNVAAMGAAETAATATRLREAQPAWADLSARERARWLRLLRDWLLDHDEALTDLIQAETGKVRAEAAVEVPVVAEGLNYLASHAARFTADQRGRASGALSMHKRLRVTHRPYPLVGVIAPWNFPLLTPALDSVAALLAGCAVVLKPSELTPLSAMELEAGWSEIGAPDVFAVATGAGPTGAAVVDLVDYVQFTGSTNTGRVIAEKCAARLVPCSLELGGKDAAIVLADADLDRAVAGIAWGGLFNAGQACTSVERVYVEEQVHDAFVERLVAEVESLRVGGTRERGGAEVGSLASPSQRDKVAEHVEKAVAAGARVATGGHGLSVGAYYAPTVLVDVDHTMACMTEETFGPTLPVMCVADEDEAIRLANDSEYGLSASVWTGDRKRGERIARQLAVGAVNVNDAIVNSYAFGIPQGGWKGSGIGARFGGAAGVLKYTRPTAITTPRLVTPKREPGWFPYTQRRTRLTRRLMRFAVGRGRRRFGSISERGQA